MSENWIDQIILTDDKICIRTPMLEDIKNVKAIWEDEDTMESTGGVINYSEENLKKWMDYQNAKNESKGRYFLIFDKEDNLIGEVSFGRYDYEKKQAMFNIKILYTERSKGYGKRAMQIALDYYFNVFGGEVMIDELALDNEGGQASLKKFGFVHNEEIPTIYDGYVLYMDKRMFREIHNPGIYKDIKQPEVITIDNELRLRKFDGKYDFAYEWYQNLELVRLVDGENAKAYMQDKLKNMYEYLDSYGELYFIEILVDGEYQAIGDVTFTKDDLPIVIGDVRYQGKGIGKKVLNILIGRAKELDINSLYVREIYDYNIASQKLFKSVGFKESGETDKGKSYILNLK